MTPAADVAGMPGQAFLGTRPSLIVRGPAIWVDNGMRLALAAGVMMAVLVLGAGAADGGEREVRVFERPAPGSDLVGEPAWHLASYEDTFVDLGMRHGLGFVELERANPGVDAWLPGEGTRLALPKQFLLPEAPRRGIVLNTAEMRLYWFPSDQPGQVVTFPVSIGRGEWATPVGETRIVAKVQDPAWYPPASIREEYAAAGIQMPGEVPAGPDNPLGRYALDLDLPGYLIHGTTRPAGIGMRVTHGCIRLHPGDIEMLFQRVPAGTGVNIVHQPWKAGWHEGVLYLEVHPPVDAVAGSGVNLSAMVDAIIRATTSSNSYRVDWERARQIAEQADGMPHPVGAVSAAD